MTSTTVVIVLAMSLFSCGGDPIAPKQLPKITNFTASPADILPGDSTKLTYSVQLATGLSLKPGDISLSELAAGSIWVSPSVPTAYSLVATNTDGVDSASLNITMSGAVPSFQSFSLSDDTLLAGESATISWQVVRADSIVVDNDIGKLSSPVSGQLVVQPNITTSYRAIAYNQIGRDTITISLLVHVPESVQSLGGLYFTSLMGQAVQTPAMNFRVVDKAGLSISSLWIHFSIIEGDGTLSADSALPNINGAANVTYNFSGALGHATVRAMVPGLDSVDVIIRANTLIFGPSGQGQYALFGESFGMTKVFNGPPVDDASDPIQYIQYQDYEDALGVVIMIHDLNQDSTANDDEPVLGVIVNTIYPHKTADSIGIGSHINEVLALYGLPENIIVDTLTPPPGIAFDYQTLGLTFWTNPADSVIFEIHLVEPTASLMSGQPLLIEKRGNSSQYIRPYRYYRGNQSKAIAP